MPQGGKTGFGVGGVMPPPSRMPSDRELKAAAGDSSAILQLIQADIRRIADKYVERPTIQPIIFNLTGTTKANATQVIDMTTLPTNAFAIYVYAGTINLFIGEYSGAGQADVPNFGVYSLAGIATDQKFLTLEGRKFVLINPSTTVTASGVFIPLAI